MPRLAEMSCRVSRRSKSHQKEKRGFGKRLIVMDHAESRCSGSRVVTDSAITVMFNLFMKGSDVKLQYG